MSRFGPDIETALVRELLAEWGRLNERHFGRGMRPPLMAVGEGRARLGCWHRETRTLELSRSMIRERPWGEVVEVLRHEMAHQYVDEVLEVTDETPHGPAFQRVCEELGIDAAASGRPQVSPDVRDRILGKVQRLLALAESPNEHEAQAAMNAAHRLMLRHNIGLLEAEASLRYVFKHLGEPRARVPGHEKLLGGLLSSHFFVAAIRVTVYVPGEQRHGRVLEICGTPENVEIASYVYDFLLQTGERLWRDHKRAEHIRGSGERLRYLLGVMTGFWEKLQEQARICRDEEGLVWVGDPGVKAYQRQRYPHQRKGRGPQGRRTATWAAGRRAGREIVLHRGVDAKASNRGRLLEGE